MNAFLHVRFLLIATTSSYVTLGFADPATAQRLWALYAVVTFVLSLVNFIYDLRRP